MDCSPAKGRRAAIWAILLVCAGVVAQSNDFVNMHTTADTPDNVPWTGLEAATRAYAKIIDDVNKTPPEGSAAASPARPTVPGEPGPTRITLR